MYLSVIIPAYNESKRIGKTLQSVGDYLVKKPFEAEVLVVNNNSKDDTVQVVQGFQKQFPFIKVIDEPKPGKGYAVTAGMLKARGEYRLFMDADNSTTVDNFSQAEPLLKEGADVVIASLAVPGSKVVRGEPAYRQVLGKLGNLFIQLFAVWGIKDTQRGFKVFSAEAVEKIFPKLTIFGWGFDVEVLALAQHYHYKIKEIPITWDNDPNSKVNIWAYPQVLLQTLKIFWNLATRQYN